MTIEDSKMIRVWYFDDAPKQYRDLSTNGGDEDWLALVPKDYKRNPLWLEFGTFGVCSIDSYECADGTVYIGCHA